ncbi:ECF RNA polymerase sigma-E factor [Symmachiella macrocystis]|uniref:RNA polymerase sigma factor n=1 Tax=Symmachiella macrocystis TaxID=2527985 RepID=A0A5C6BG44_9PLAN|nr:RNA polymerase sigma factor [Symmachiella macrocystis]TWU09414.1 ECF RNA polymerase sigma-E factor [Symmachiella macrocystis]
MLDWMCCGIDQCPSGTGVAVRLDDAEIMQRVKTGDVALFDELVRRYREPLLHVAWSKLGHREWAEDVVQEAFLAAYAARETYNPDFSFRTWLWTILLNLCRRQWKRRAVKGQELTQAFQSERGPSEPGQAGFQEPICHDCGLAQMLETEQRQNVLRMIAQLPEPQGDAIRLRFFAGLKFDEIAAAMESAVSTAKVRVRNGLRELTQQLQNDDEGPPGRGPWG